MRIAIGSDHHGFVLKQVLIKQLQDIQFVDVGCFTPERTDYPSFAAAVVEQIPACAGGVLICGTGAGMAITANRFPGIYAAVVCSADMARRVKEEDNANILVLPADYMDEDQALDCVRAWLQASFKGGQYATRCTLIDALAKQ